MKQGLVVIDLQNEYLPTGKLPLSGIEAAVANARRVIDHARNKGIPVFHIRHESDDANVPIFVKGSSGAQIQPEVAPEGDEPVIVKKTSTPSETLTSRSNWMRSMFRISW